VENNSIEAAQREQMMMQVGEERERDAEKVFSTEKE
jgi:hypothetical protein